MGSPFLYGTVNKVISHFAKITSILDILTLKVVKLKWILDNQIFLKPS